MALQFSVTLRDNQLDQIESTIGNTSAVLKIFSGSEPSACSAADPTGLLATISLPNPWMNAAASGQKTIAGTWTTSASAAGTAASFRVYDSAAVCHLQGSVTATGGGGDLTLDNTSLASGQAVNITGFTITAGNA